MRRIMILAILLLAGSLYASDSLPTPGFKEPLGLGWDKPMHFAAGALAAEFGRVMAGTTGEITGLWPRHGWFSDTVAPILAAGVAGALKETSDAQEPGNKWDTQDFLATVAGSIPGAGIRLTWAY